MYIKAKLVIIADKNYYVYKSQTLYTMLMSSEWRVIDLVEYVEILRVDVGNLLSG
jgi:hypothetical protein